MCNNFSFFKITNKVLVCVFMWWSPINLRWVPFDRKVVIDERNEHHLYGVGSVPKMKCDGTAYSIFSTIHSCQTDSQLMRCMWGKTSMQIIITI